MKLIKKGILFYVSLIGISIIIQSCCESNIKIIGNGDMFISQIDNSRQDTIRNEFRVVLYLELQYADNFNHSGIISSSYATTCSQNYINTMNRDSLKLYCDKDFTFEGEVIEAETNFLNEDKMSIYFSDEGGEIDIRLNQEFLNDSEFSEGIHEFKIEIGTSDGGTFTNSVSTFLEI